MRLWYAPSLLWDPTQFLDTVTDKLEQSWIDISNLFIDHICYRASSRDDYEEKKKILWEWSGQLLVESEIWWRLIATYKLFDPIVYRWRLIEILELPSPKLGSLHPTWREHVEFVVPEALESFYLKHSDRVRFQTKWLSKKRNPDLEIEFESWVACKFHTQTLEKIISEEIVHQ